MATTTTITDTSIELETRPSARSDPNPANTSSIRNDDVVEASRIVDSGVPEGGYGWVAVAACGAMCFWFVGTTYAWGVIQGALVAEGLSSASTLSWVGSITVACNAILAISSARVLRAIGSRRTAFAGITFLGGGQILSGFSVHNIGGLFFTSGIVMGIGVSLSFIVGASVPAQYFSRKRGLANGIVFACGGLGGAAISLMMESMLQRLGTAWTFRLIGAMTLVTGLPAAWFVKDRVAPNRRTFIEWQLFKYVLADVCQS